MPPVIAALGTVAFAGITYGQIVQGAIVVAGLVRSRREAKKAAARANASLSDRTMPVRVSDAARTLVYGRTRVSGPIVYHRNHGSNRESVSHVIALAGHEIDAVEDVWFNDKSIKPWTSGYVTSGSDYFLSRPEALTQSATGTGAAQAITLDLAGGTLLAVDSVAYNDGDLIEVDAGQVVRDARYVTLASGTQYTVAGAVVSISAIIPTGAPITITYRVERGVARAAVWVGLGGAAGEADANLTTWSDNEWTSSAIGCNVARLHVLTTWDETLYATGFPSVSAIVRGKKVYDPRLDSTNGGSGAHRADTASTWAYSDNPALCAADYLRATLGFGCASTEIDWPSVIAAANVCDELVAVDGVNTIKRYICAGVLSTETERRANLEAILDSMVGMAVYSGGKWTIRAGAYVTPTLDMDEGDLAGGDITIQARANRRDLFNAVRGRYRDPLQLYQVTDFPPYSSATYAAEDAGEVIYREIDLDMVDDARRAQRIAKLLLFRARQALTMQASFKLAAYALQPGDTCRLTIGRYGWTNKVFRVLRREFESLTTVRLTLQEDASAIYAWAFNEAAIPDPAPNTSLADPRYVRVPSNVTFTSDTTTYITRADGTYVPYVEVAWAVPAEDDVHVEVFWKRASETEYRRVVAPIGASYAWLEGVTRGDVLNIYLDAVNAIGARSAKVWRSTYEVEAVVQQSTAIVAANWIENAQCYTGIDTWLSGAPSPNVLLYHNVETNGAAGPLYVLAGTPADKGSGLFVVEVGDRPANGVSDVWIGHAGRRVPVIAGERIEGSAYLCTHRCTVDLRIAYFGVDGAYITEQSVSGAPRALNDGSQLRTLAQYVRVGGFSTVPANAATALLFLRKYGRNAGLAAQNSYVFATNFYLGPAVAQQTELSPWSPGALRVVTTETLQPGAATQVVTPAYNAAGLVLSLDTLAFGDLALGAIAAEASGTLEVTVICEVAGSASGGSSTLVAGIYETAKRALIEREVMTLASGESRAVSLTLRATIDVARGDVVAPRLRLRRSRFGLGVGNTTDAVRKVETAFVLIKR